MDGVEWRSEGGETVAFGLTDQDSSTLKYTFAWLFAIRPVHLHRYSDRTRVWRMEGEREHQPIVGARARCALRGNKSNPRLQLIRVTSINWKPEAGEA